MGAQIKVKQITGLQSTLDALMGIDKVSETFTTTATDGGTGILISQPARESDAIQVFVNGQKLQEGYSWKKDGAIITASSLEASTELVWSSSIAGFDLESTDEIQIEYETLTSGNTLQGNSGISGTITGNLIPDTNEAYDLGSPDKKFRDIYMSGNTLYMGGQPLSIVNGTLTLNGTPVTGSVQTQETIRERLHWNESLLNWVGPDEVAGTKYKLKTDYLTLGQGDELFQLTFDPAGDGSTDYAKSFNHLHTMLARLSKGVNTVPEDVIGTTLIHSSNGETLKYKAGSLRGYMNMSGYNTAIETNTYPAIPLDNTRIFVVGFENLDPTWPSTDPSQMPTLFGTYTDNNGGIVDQHIRARLLDAVSFSGTYFPRNAIRIDSSSSDFQASADIDITNYVAISIFSHSGGSPLGGDEVIEGTLNYTILRS